MAHMNTQKGPRKLWLFGTVSTWPEGKLENSRMSHTVYPHTHQAAGIPKRFAKSIGIAVDYRRKNRSLESLQENTARLKAYKANLVLFPRKGGKPAAGEASEEELKAVVQHTGPIMPAVAATPELELVPAASLAGRGSAFKKLRRARINSRLNGLRKKKAAERAAAEKDQ